MARKQSEGEQWPVERRTDDGIRHRLRHLFAPTGDEEIEQAIVDRGRELEERTAQLQQTVTDLERREERTRQLRAAVEQMLRHGAAELDDRHAELNVLALQLAEREEALAAGEQELSQRRADLGAVELRRAALERREEAVAEREAALAERGERLERAAEELTQREAALAVQETALAEREDRAAATPTPAEAPRPEGPWLVFVPGARYRLLERQDDPPATGSVLEVEGARYRVARLGPSPLPGDARRCAYLEPARGHPEDG